MASPCKKLRSSDVYTAPPHSEPAELVPEYFYATSNRANRKRPNRFWSLIKLSVFAALALAIVYFALLETLHRSIQGQLEQKINEALPDGVHVAARNATFIEGVGFHLEDLNLETRPNHQGPPSTLMNIESLMIHLPISAPELVMGQVQPTAIKISRAKISIERNADGTWNFDPLIGCLENFQSDVGCELIPIDLEDSQVTLVDRTLAPPRVVELNQINIKIRPFENDGRKLIRLQGALLGVAVAEIGFDAFLDPIHKTWRARVSASNAKISTDLFRFLPDSLKPTAQLTEMLGGQLNLSGDIQGAMDGSLPRIDVTGNLRGFAVKHPNIPFMLTRTNVDFQLSNDQVAVTRATGQLNEASFDLAYHQTGLLEPENWQLNGQLTNYEFKREMLAWMPHSCEKFCDDFSPAGTSDIRFDFVHDGQNLRKRIIGTVKDMSFSFAALPYLVEHCTGKINWVDDDCQINLTANDRGQQILITGNVNRPGKQATFQFDLELNGALPIDEKLLGALRPMPDLERSVLAFRPTGRISGKGHVSKSDPNRPPNRTFELQLHQCNVRHESFEYPIHNVNGAIKYRDGRTTFERITGSSGIAKIECNGNWEKQHGLSLRFLCNQVPLNEQLRQAIPVKIREIWNGFRPQGVVGILRVDLVNPPDAPIDISVNASLAENPNSRGLSESTVSIHPKWFPYTIRKMTGNVEVGGGKIKLTHMNGFHDLTKMIWNGEGSYSDDAWSLLLRKIIVGPVTVNEELLSALPASLAPAIRQLQFKGSLLVSGDIHLAGRANPTASANSQVVQAPANSAYINDKKTSASHPYSDVDENWNTSMGWDLRFDIDHAEMLVGLPIEHVFGIVELQGHYDGKKANCRGQLTFSSLTLYDAQITQVTGPIWIDENWVLAGSTVGVERSQQPPTPITGKLFGGTLRLDAQKSIVGDGKYTIWASLAQSKLAEAVAEFAPHLEQITGMTFASLKFQGDDSGVRSYRGNGNLQIRDAKIYELPIIVALLKVPYFRDLNRTAFDSSNIDFKISGDQYLLERIELIGDAISLIGNGQVSMDRDINLNFYTVMGRGRFYIPIVSELYRASSKRVLWINVDGTLENPQTHRNILPNLNESIQQLFDAGAPSTDEQPFELNIDLPASQSFFD